MISGDLKTYKNIQISKSNFFTITILSLNSICSESKNEILHKLQKNLQEKKSYAARITTLLLFKRTEVKLILRKNNQIIEKLSHLRKNIELNDTTGKKKKED